MKILKFLIIDDQTADQAYYENALRLLNVPYECYKVVSAKDALKNLDQKKIDCVLLDYQLPDLNGVELIKKIKKVYSKYIPLIMLTSQGDEQIAVNAIKAGATDYLKKNQIEPESLKKIILDAIRGSQLKKMILKQKKLLKHYTFHDRLTGLMSRHTFEAMVNRSLCDAKRFSYSVAIVIIDLDNFMVINDSLGRLAGNALLIEISKYLHKIFPDEVIISRLQDDKFAVLLTGEDLKQTCSDYSAKLINKIREPLHLSIDTLYISASIGIASYPENGDDFPELIKKANIALSRAKESGGGLFEFYFEK